MSNLRIFVYLDNGEDDLGDGTLLTMPEGSTVGDLRQKFINLITKEWDPPGQAPEPFDNAATLQPFLPFDKGDWDSDGFDVYDEDELRDLDMITFFLEKKKNKEKEKEEEDEEDEDEEETKNETHEKSWWERFKDDLRNL